MANVPKELFSQFQDHLNKEQDLREVRNNLQYNYISTCAKHTFAGYVYNKPKTE